jgi:hypothetical protein
VERRGEALAQANGSQEEALARAREEAAAQVEERLRQENLAALDAVRREEEQSREAVESERDALRAQLDATAGGSDEVEALRSELARMSRAMDEAAQRQARELEEVERVLREEAEEAIAAERQRLQAQLPGRSGPELAARSVAEFRSDDEERELLRRLREERDALAAERDQLARKLEEASPPPAQATGAAPRDEEARRVLDPGTIRELMERRRELLRSRTKEREGKA